MAERPPVPRLLPMGWQVGALLFCGVLVVLVIIILSAALRPEALVTPPMPVAAPRAPAPPSPSPPVVAAAPQPAPRTIEGTYHCTDAEGWWVWQSHPCAPPPDPAVQRLQQACQAAQHTRTHGVTRESYDLIETGDFYGGQGYWTFDDLTCLFGQPGEQVSAAGSQETYRWRGSQGAVIVLSIQNLGASGIYHIYAKSQRGLP